MDLKDMILVTENDRGTETNMLMTLDDYKSFIAIDDMSELAENLLQLGRTLGEADNFTEYYRAANVTVSARFCLCLLYTSPSPRDMRRSRMPSSA